MYDEAGFQLVKVWVLCEERDGDIFTFADEDLNVVKDYYQGLHELDKKNVTGIYTSIAVKDDDGNIHSVWKDDNTLQVPDTLEGLPIYLGGEVYM